MQLETDAQAGQSGIVHRQSQWHEKRNWVQIAGGGELPPNSKSSPTATLPGSGSDVELNRRSLRGGMP